MTCPLHLVSRAHGWGDQAQAHSHLSVSAHLCTPLRRPFNSHYLEEGLGRAVH